MTNPSTPPQALQQRAGVTIISDTAPSYVAFRHLPERERWAIYELAKSGRMTKDDQGNVSSETYDAFVRRVTEELDL